MLSINFDKLGIFTTGKHPPLYLVRSDMREAKTDAGHEGTWLCGCCVRSLWGATCALTEPEHQLERLGLPAQRQPGPNASDTSSTSPFLLHETCTRSTGGCGSLGAGDLASGAYPCLRPREGATRPTGQVRRGGATRPAAAARRSGAEMDETYGLSTSEGYPRITRPRIIILTYPGLCKSGHLIPSYPGYASLDILSQLIQGNPRVIPNPYRKMG